MHNTKLIPSPCKSICKLKDDICVGCLRTKDEIARWQKLSNDEKKEVIDRIAKITANT